MAEKNVQCTLCERGNLLEWKCLSCKDLLCNDCKVYHKKLRATKDHQVISIKELNEDEILKSVDQSVNCREHDETCQLFCMDCNFPICTDKCIQRHDGHRFEPIEDLRQSIEESTNELIDIIRTKTKSFDTIRDIEEDDRQRIKKELKQRKQLLISIIESKYGKLTANLQDIYQNSNEQKHTENIYQSVIKLRDKQASLEEIMKTSNVEEFAKSFSILNEEIKTLLQNIPDEKQVSFQPGVPDIHFGSLGYKSKSTEIKNISSLTSLETVRIIQTNHNEVDMICPNSNDTTWIGGQNDARVQLIQNSSGRSIKEIETNVSNGCVRSDKLYLCCLNEKSVLAISLDGTVATIKDMQPLYPVCIYVTSTDDILVGAICELNNYDLDSKNRRVMITMNDKGEVKKELSLDVNGIKLFVKPYRCIVNELTNELVVLDKTSGGNGRVVCISSNDEIKFRYFGRSSDELAYEFNPLGIDIATNYIIVLDFSNHALDIVNDEGYMIKWISIEMNEICSLAFDSAGQLWLGNHDKTRAEIFITRLK